MSYITRSLEKVVQQVTQEYSVVLVTGPRQVYVFLSFFLSLHD